MSHTFAIFWVFLAVGDDDAFKALAAVDRYAFTIDSEAPGLGGVQGKYRKGVPLWLQADKIEFFRQGDVLVYKQGDKWQRTRTGTLSDPLRILAASAKVRAARLPHEELGALAKLWDRVKKTEDKGQTILSGELGEKAAKELARPENRPVAQAGKAQVWLGSKGEVVKYTLTLRLQGRLGGAEVDGSISKTVVISGLGVTPLELPADAKKALD